ncbi:hypothetical protein [Jeongeupia chitinilytica]|uniref:Uncharacterized protein n=1 Tax=Jeongeupia chitinilytica TaxID=1041641 RepID=A0ABQ3GXR8_9NEIS|nr:hypothetical protein [Jeongeupia chitinilytica]GHD59770.1 hypothetical protein GCM10007350_11480 [Jeongeupia chitinilytica]
MNITRHQLPIPKTWIGQTQIFVGTAEYIAAGESGIGPCEGCVAEHWPDCASLPSCSGSSINAPGVIWIKARNEMEDKP